MNTVFEQTGRALGWPRGDEPALASPYDLPAPMARWAFTIFVDAIIFIDCGHTQLLTVSSDAPRRTKTDLCDFLNVSDRLETKLNLPQRRHVARW
jgi:hypothetical protein